MLQDVRASANEETKGVYKDKYGKCDSKMGEMGGGGACSWTVEVEALRAEDSEE